MRKLCFCSGNDEPRASWFRGHATCAVVQGTTLTGALLLVRCFAIAVLKFQINFEQMAPHFYFALGLVNHVVASG